jgi:hypothetical protein
MYVYIGAHGVEHFHCTALMQVVFASSPASTSHNTGAGRLSGYFPRFQGTRIDERFLTSFFVFEINCSHVYLTPLAHASDAGTYNDGQNQWRKIMHLWVE